MYRQYEDPRELHRQVEEEQERQQAKVARGEELDEYDWERLQDLKDRENFAWQDEEYDFEITAADLHDYMYGI